MANCLIICEGVTDRTLIGEYLKGISGWVYTTIGNNLFNDYDINWFKRGEEKLGIGIVNGDDFLPFAGDFAFRHRNSPQDIERLIIVTDNDDEEEVNDRFINILKAMDEKLGHIHNFNPRESMNRWLSVDYIDEFSQDACFQYCFLTVPIEEQGSLETYMLKALANNQEEGVIVVGRASEFVEELATSKYLKRRRDKTKAKLGVAMSVFSPNRSVDSMLEIISVVDWKNFKETHRQFEILEQL